MYGQGNRAPVFGQSPNIPVLPPQQQHPQVPPPPPPQFYPPGLPHVFGPSAYQDGSVTADAMHIGSSIGVANSSRSYLHPPLPPPIHGSAFTSSVYPNAQQSLQYASASGIQNVHHISASVPPPLQPSPEMLRPSQNHRVLNPPPPSQGQMYRNVVHQPPKPGGIQGRQHIPFSPPLPPISGSLAVTTYGNLESPADGDPNLPSQAPPPPPSSPPPIPPSPPPSYSTPVVASSNMIHSSDTAPSSKELLILETGDPKFVDESLRHDQFRDNAPLHDNCLSRKGGSSSLSGDGENGVVLDFPLPPRKPTSEKLVQKIEVLCQYIAKNGPEFESMARQNEFRNSEFEFLFGGQPGSEAAIAHEYFVWMKRKCTLACKGLDGQGNSPLRPPQFESPYKPDHLMVAAGSCFPADSDMEMEDDITQLDKDPEVYQSTEVLNHDLEFDVNEQLHIPQRPAECSLSKAGFPEKELGEQGKGKILPHDTTRTNSNRAAENPAEILFTSVADVQSTDSDLAVVEGTNNAGNHGFLIQGGSPFRLLQEYASDDENDNQTRFGDVCSAKLSPPISADSRSWHVNMGSNLDIDIKSKRPCKSGREFDKLSKLTESHMPHDSQVEMKETIATTSKSKRLDEPIDNSDGSSQKNDGSEHAGKNVVFESDKSHKALNPLKLDEFGRLVKANATDSDSDDSRSAGRRHKRGRSRSRSLSPRRWRKSPHRRRERQSRSRSLSPRKRRSSSRSHMFRRDGEFSGNNMRQRKCQTSVCFNFLEGKCYRGASCKYRHDSDRADGSRKQDLEAPPVPKDCDIHEATNNISLNISDNNDDEVNGQGKLPFEDTTGGSFGAINSGNITGIIEDSVINVPESIGFDESCKSTDSTHRAADITSTTSPNKLLISEPSKLISSIHSYLVMSCSSQPILSEKFPSGIMVPKELSPPSPSTTDLPYTPASLPPPPPQLLQGVNDPDKPHPTRDHNLLSQTASLPYSSEDNFPHYMLPSQQSHFTLPTSSSWTLTNPPAPPMRPYGSIINAGNKAPGASSQFPQSYLPPNNESGTQNFLRSYPSDLPTHSHIGEFQQRAFHPMQQPHLSVLRGEHSFNSPLLGNLPSQQFGGPSYLGEDRLPQIFEQGSFSRANIHPRPTHLEGGLPANKVQPFPGEHLPPGELLLSSHKQQQLSHFVQQQSTADSLLGQPGKLVSSSIQMADYVDRSKLSRPPDFGGSRLSSYHNNPYASTFEQPLSSKFSYDAFRNETFTPYGSKCDASFSLNHVTTNGEGVMVVGSRQMSSSPNSSRAVTQMLCGSGNDQYDPLFDSIEPSSNSFKKLEHAQKQESTNDSDILIRCTGSNKPLDVAENSQKKEAAIVAPTTSLDNDEFGETADAEVGAVENDSPSNSIHLENTNEGEIEINQTKSTGKSKKSKDSRSMKLFKIAIADFVKEVLRPSWRQGNMSKEAFKTIVKKTVDKVSGAMKGHKMPKSEAKINHYIDSSQRKLTKLVMGYVDKYVKL